MTAEPEKKKSGGKILACTICCREKDRAEAALPAIGRYRSGRIQTVFHMAEKEGLEFAILSGKFGLLHPEDLIPYYDKLLTEEDIPALNRQMAEFLRENPARGIIFLPPDPRSDSKVMPYIKCMRRAARKAKIPLRIKFVPPYPERILAPGE